ncbi:MAG: hypothetical protein ACE5DM_02075 [Candidatus Nanoarchaeia archaeon]
MGFFSTENPIALLLAAIITYLVLRTVLSKLLGATKWGGKHKEIVSVLITISALIVITSIPFLRMVATTMPFIALFGVLICLSIIAYVSLGATDNNILLVLKNRSFNFYTWLLVVLIVVWGSSLIWGPSLLENKGISLTGFAQAEEKQMDFSFLFTKEALGFVLVFSILGLTFFTINKG